MTLVLTAALRLVRHCCLTPGYSLLCDELVLALADPVFVATWCL